MTFVLVIFSPGDKLIFQLQHLVLPNRANLTFALPKFKANVEFDTEDPNFVYYCSYFNHILFLVG